MIRNSFLYVAVLAFFAGAGTPLWAQQNITVYKNAHAPVAQRVKDLVSRMTLDEKIGQLSTLLGWPMYEKNGDEVNASEEFKKAIATQHIGMLWGTLRADPWTKKTLENGLNPYLAAKATNALQKWSIEHSRLQIPVFIAEECPHGHMAIGTTVFPTAIGQSSTWDTGLIQEMAATIAKEARLQGAHIGYGPILDLARELRWSRVEETYGEDTYLNGSMGEVVVRGFQGKGIGSGTNIIATLKHFTAYGVPEGGHNGGAVNLGQRALMQNYLPPFKAAVKAGALSVMTAYNSIDGIPCSSNTYLLNDVLRKQWGFNGFVVSDLNSISGATGADHVAGTEADAAALSINAGLDNDLGGNTYATSLLKAIKGGQVKMTRIDEAVGRILKLKFEMGLFEHPYVDAEIAKAQVRDEKAVALARKVADESIILLKNERNLLPLNKAIKSIAVIGPNADNMYNQLGDYTAPQPDDNIVTVLQGIRSKLPASANIRYVKGCAIRDTTQNDIAKAVEAALQSDVAVVVLGGSSARDFKTNYQATGAAVVNNKSVSDMESGEGYDRESLDMMGRQLQLLQAVAKTGKPVVLVLIEGRPLNINWAAANIPAIINAWYPGQQGGNAVADVLFGDYNPAGRLPVSIPVSVGQLPVYYSYQNGSHHDYVEGSAKPLYSFGYGLSYSAFQYTDAQTKVTENANDVLVKVSFKVKNTGSRDGDEVVQLYVKDEVSSVVVPNKQLRRFQRVHLAAGEEKQITFDLTAADLSLIDQNYKRVAEKGGFRLLIGGNSDRPQLTTRITLSRSFTVVE
ncbi:glycoside hydrolase family 3 C-terminal domain-containing protein [Mucilaginibacter mali]|uniref:Glycoside hydrolase family 3 C-terminal domain-containing protein n=1 Tax=Mucilaginibacter mali TaxID=2740462 RepID=A0A7D4U9G0_9SPHI|nr:glycoside hydrolase family 3 N-terminal domain-containing protein [Mucilaginibacter mali]QKJ29018.1 glycoside hydrolase family 3 C-terminal domain-containing protein [Mucilaginibacter mali]